jgi:hypothetical protein
VAIVFVPHIEGRGESHESMLQGFAEMGLIGKMEVLFICVACFVQIASVARQMRLRIDARAFCEQIRKLLAAGNADRALKLCAAAPASPVAILVKTGLEAAKSSQSARDAVSAAYPRVLAATRGGLLFVLVTAAVALCAGAVLIAQDGIENIASVPLFFVAVFGLFNVLRFVAWPRELTLASTAFE